MTSGAARKIARALFEAAEQADANAKENAQPRIYYAVPNLYGIGDKYESLGEATREARSRIREIDGCPGSFTREFVDVRCADRAGDRPVHRYEIFKDGYASVELGR